MNYLPEGVYPLGTFRDRWEKELLLRSALESQANRLPIKIRQQRKLKFAKLSKWDRLDVNARFEVYHTRGRVPVGCMPGDQNVSGVQSDVALGPDR